MNETEEKETLKKRNQKEYKKLKLKLDTLQNGEKKKLLSSLGILTAIFISIMFFLLFREDTYMKDSISLIFSCTIGVSSGVLIIIYGHLLIELQENKIRREMIEYEAEDIKEDIKEDIFENSIKMSYKYLDQYYLQTREHAQRGFLVTVCVAVFGAVLIGAGIIAMFIGETSPSYVTCASGVITEFISAIFFYLYNRTISSMSKYHNKLVLSQNISIALKVADSLPTDDKVKAKNEIIKELLRDINSYLVKSDSDEKRKINKKEN